jgi:hypothetical protein
MRMKKVPHSSEVIVISIQIEDGGERKEGKDDEKERARLRGIWEIHHDIAVRSI